MSWTVREGDARELLATVSPGSVQCVVTSPPYYQLRDYRVTGQIGLEATPEDYLRSLVGVFAQARRALADDGTLWLVIGDSYADKNLLMIPARLALALRADGWVLRADIIWAKPNVLPENVSDRPTRAHEHVLLLAKQRSYAYDADAIRERTTDWSRGGPGVGIQRTDHYGPQSGGNGGLAALAQRYRDGSVDPTRNCRDVWEIPPQAYPGAHFATFPTRLVERCLLAGSTPGSLVLDPFCGSGTTGVVCEWLRREFLGFELSPAYAEMARTRISVEGPLRRPAHREAQPDERQLTMFAEQG